MYELINIILTILNIILVVVNSYWAYQRTCHSRDTLHGSEKYWESWKERSKDVAKSVLKEISTSDLEKELRERYAKEKKKKKSRRTRKGNRRAQETTSRKAVSN